MPASTRPADSAGGMRGGGKWSDLDSNRGEVSFQLRRALPSGVPRRSSPLEQHAAAIGLPGPILSGPPRRPQVDTADRGARPTVAPPKGAGSKCIGDPAEASTVTVNGTLQASYSAVLVELVGRRGEHSGARFRIVTARRLSRLRGYPPVRGHRSAERPNTATKTRPSNSNIYSRGSPAPSGPLSRGSGPITWRTSRDTTSAGVDPGGDCWSGTRRTLPTLRSYRPVPAHQAVDAVGGSVMLTPAAERCVQGPACSCTPGPSATA